MKVFFVIIRYNFIGVGVKCVFWKRIMAQAKPKDTIGVSLKNFYLISETYFEDKNEAKQYLALRRKEDAV